MKRVIVLDNNEIFAEASERISLSAIDVDVDEGDYDYVFVSSGKRLLCMKARDGEVGEYDAVAFYRLLAATEMSTDLSEQ